MWNILQEQNSMNTKGTHPDFLEVIGILKNLVETVERDRANLPSGTMVQIRFEDLEASPVEVLKGVYREFEIPFSNEFETGIKEFMRQNQTFKKNIFTLTAEKKSIIAREMENQIKTCHYDRDFCF
jgi:hypothetical protein